MTQYRSLAEIRQAISLGTTSCTQLVKGYLATIAARNGELNAFVEVYEQEAVKQAEVVDAKIAKGTAGPLAGMVISVKDVIVQKDHRVSAGSKILENFESQFTATALQRLLLADAIVIGRVNCDEFAMGSSNETSYFGACRNALDAERVAGGSSGGSAASVAADMCLVSIGSDTGGSVRQPAAFNGIVGLKPTYSRISRFGLIAYASSFDSIGVLAHSVSDAALALEVMAGQDPMDSTSSSQVVPEYAHNLGSEKKYKIGYLQETLESEGLDPEIKTGVEARLAELKEQGHTVEPVHFTLLDYVLPTYYILVPAEASSNLSRFDGARYGFRAEDPADLLDMYKRSRSEGFGEEVKRRIMIGTFVLSASYYDAYYTKAQKVRRMVRDETKQLLSEYDFLVTPTTPSVPWKLGEVTDPIQYYLADLFTVQASVSGLPAISIPNGTTEAGLPMGLQIIANSFEEQNLLSFAESMMKNH